MLSRDSCDSAPEAIVGEWSVDRNGTRWTVWAEPGSGEVSTLITPPGPFVVDVDTAQEMRLLLFAAINTAQDQKQ
jgi:hypothetical protein